MGARELWNEVREILLLLTRTTSAFKIFPPEHASIRQFLDDLYRRLSAFLEEHLSLDLIIGENFFEFMEERVFEDEDTARSLPFFFFRDGMQRLSFHRGLRKEELRAWLETIKTVASLPPEEADIVTALWERNFENITFYAPDEFIIDKITSGRPVPEYEVNPDELYSGQIDLAPDDRQAIEEWKIKAAQEDVEPPLPQEAASTIWNEASTDLQEEEWKAIETILHGYRHLPPDEELARLLLEILYLEDRPEQLPSFKDSFRQAHRQLIQNGKFGAAASFLHDLSSLKNFFTSQAPEKAKLIDSFFADLGEEDELALIKEAYKSQKEKFNQDDFLAYLQALGQPGLAVIASFYEDERSLLKAEVIQPFLRSWAAREPKVVMKLAQESRPHLACEVIRVLGDVPERKVVTFLASFISSGQPILRREAVKALSRLHLPAARKMLLGFLQDEKEEIRILAAQNLEIIDESMLEHLLHFVSLDNLKRKGPEEAAALLLALARTTNPLVRDYFGQLFRRSWLFRPKVKRICLLAVAALKAAADSQALELLEAGRTKGRGKLRRACHQACRELNLPSKSEGSE